MARAKSQRASLGKTTRPSLSGILPRQRLFALLDEARERPVVWVSGPPGCGKTTAVASYLDHAGLDALWYQLDEGDADVATFFYYLGLAAQAHGKGAPLPLLTPEYHAGLAVFTRRYFEALYRRLEPPFVVVFDGCHEVAPFSPFHGVLRDALAALPAGGNAILISRGDPPAEMARLRASRAVATLGWDELRLTRDETDAIARQRRRGLPADALERLYARTQGWAAGLVLMLEQAKMSGAIGDAPDLSTRQLVFDYLAGEIFQKTDGGTQELLLNTAYLSQMTAGTAQALTGNEQAGRILADLHRNNYFVALREAHPEPVYQYHPMFREFLVARIQESVPKDRRRHLQRAAAAAMEKAGQVEEAVGLYRESRDWDEMARLIGAHAEAVLAQGRGETLARWAEELPPEARERHPWVVHWAAASQAQLAPREARVLYEKAWELFRAQPAPDLTGMALAASGAMDAILYELDDFSLLDRWIAAVDAAEQARVTYPSAQVEARVACSMVFSLTLRQPHRRDLERWVERALERAQRVEDPNLRIFVGLLCSLTLMWTGLYAKAQGLVDAMRRMAAAPGTTPFSRLTLKNVEAMYYMLTAQREPCLKAAEEGLEIARSTGVHTWTFQLLVYAYGGALAGQDLERAQALAGQLGAHAAGAGRFNLCLYHHFQAWEAMLRKDLMRALQLERTALRMAVEVGCPYFEVLCRLALAEVLAECGDERKSVAHLLQLRPLVEAVNNHHLEFTCLVGVGRLALDHGRPRPGRNALRRGFALGREYGYAHFLWWRPAAMARACAYALEAGIEPEYAKDLIRRRALTPETPPLQVKDWPWAFRVTSLGGFSLLRHDAPLASGGKAQRRPLDLLKVLVAQGGERVPEERVTEALWPRIEGDSAHRSFTSTLHRLRKLLGEDRAVVLHEGKLSLDRRYFWTDAWAFDALVAEIDAALGAVRGIDAQRAEALGARLLELYRGPFLATEPESGWQFERRERLRSRFSRTVAALARAWEQAGQAARGAEFREKCFEIDPLALRAESLSHK
jgi:ATP/maltotriose-dependent transcriptional regulator MalT/DNA-binding SARP family transcriptional activator